MLQAPLPTIEDYIEYFRQQDIPVLRRSMRSLGELKEHEDSVDGRTLATITLQDPLLALRVLVYLEAHRPPRQNHDITTAARAIMMMGISPFFTQFGNLPTLEERLARHPKALVGVLKVITRAKLAAQWAREFALLRHDIDVDEVTVAALLHEVAEILLWGVAPDLMQQVSLTLQANPGLRSVVAQQAVLGVTTQDLQLALVRAWRLPELLVTLMDAEHANNPRVRNVLLACNLARHSINGWTDPAIPDDIAAIADLLHLNHSSVLHHVNAPSELYEAALQAEEAGRE